MDTPASQPATDPRDPAIRFTPESDGRSTRVELIAEERSVSRCWIVSQRIRIGRAVVRMDGIGGVGTDEGERLKGYSRRVLEAAMRRMLAGDAALTMLYGIPDYYTKFGYAPAGPEHLVRLSSSSDAALPTGWTMRGLREADIPAVRRIYDLQTREAVGPAIRTDYCYANRRLAEAAKPSPAGHDQDDMRVLIGPDGAIQGYIWRGRGFWATDVLMREAPDALVISEAMAVSPLAAEVLLLACRIWSHEVRVSAGLPISFALISAPHDGPLGRAAMRTDALLARQYTRCGGSMAHILNLPRLMEALEPELWQRLRLTGIRPVRPVCIHSGRQTAWLGHRSGSDGAGEGADGYRIALSNDDLVGALFGIRSPEEMIERYGPWPSERIPRLIRAIFPERCPHMYLPDRY
jgi:predicted acetyltransferase